MNQPATLGQLVFFGQGDATIAGSQLLTFDQPDANPAFIQLAPTGASMSITATLSSPIAIAAGEQLDVEVAPTSKLTLAGAVTAADGSIVKKGAGTLAISRSNAAWGGRLVVDSGEVSLASATSLGSGTGVLANGTRVNAGGVLRFNALVDPTDEFFQLDGGTIIDRSFGVRGNRLGRIELLSTSTLRNGVGSGYEPTVLAGNVSGPGGLNLQGDFSLSGDNSYAGETIIDAGGNLVVLSSATGLGVSSAGTTIRTNSELQLDASAAEPLAIRGGRATWRNNSQGWTGPVVIDGDGWIRLAAAGTFNFPVELAGNANLYFNNSSATWASAVTGVGDLTIGGNGNVTGNLAHQGNLKINGATLDSANGYTGTTTISQGTTTVNHAQAFGSSTTPVVVDSASAILALNQAIERDILVKNGSLELRSSGTLYDETVHLQRGTLQWEGLPFTGTISLENADVPAEVVVRGSTLNGRITGSGKLVVDGTNGQIEINSNNDYRGHTVVYGADLNSPTALGSAKEGSLISSGVTTVRVPTDEPLLVQNRGRLYLDAQLDKLPEIIRDGYETVVEVRTASVYDQRVEPRLGTLQIAAPTTLGKVAMFGDAVLRVESPGTLNLLDDEIVMQGGTIDGTIAGLNSIRKVGAGEATVRRLHNFRGEMEIAAGVLNVEELWAGGQQPTQASPNRGTLRVTSREGAVLNGAGGVVDADVYLNNARGIGAGGALNSMVLLGDLYLGDEGAYLAGNGTGVHLRGAVYGGDLIFPQDQSRSEVQITSNRAAYEGETLIRDGYLNLADRGRLTTTSRIVVGGGGELMLNNTHPYAESDRVADYIPVVMQGGSVRLWSPSEGEATERIGRLDLERGTASVVGQPGYYSWDPGKTTLTLGELERAEGSTLFFDFYYPSGVKFDQAPTLENGLIGAWATVNRIYQGGPTTDFAIYGPNGVQALTSFQQNLSAATAIDNVLVSQNATLPAGTTTINSLTLRGENDVQLSLGGRRLTVASGGLLLEGNVVNGELAPGAATNELIITTAGGSPQVSANIVDGAGGPTSLTLGSSVYGRTVRLGGANTYSNATRVNNEVTVFFDTFESLPAGGDLDLNGGEALLSYQSTVVKELGTLNVRDDGRLAQQYPGQAKVDFAEINLESGSIVDFKLVGDAPISKRGEGTATLSMDGREFSGTVDVYEGALVVEGSRSIGEQSVTVHGGSLVLQTMRNDSWLAPGDVRLNGGDLILDNVYQGKVFVNAPARISGASFSGYSRRAQPGEIVGSSPIIFGGRIDLVAANNGFSGDAVVDGHVVTRHRNGFGSGDVTVSAGGILEMAFENGGELPNDLILAGGELTTAPETAFTPFPGKTLGKITVTQDSAITTTFRDSMEIAGPLELRDGVRLAKRSEGLLTVSGDVLVGGDVEFVLEPGFLRHNDGTTIRDVVSQVRIDGVIKSAAEHASINFVRSGFDEFSLAASVHVEPGQALQILEDGVPIVYSLAPGETISGNGTFANPVHIDGGVIAPGQSPGTLAFANGLTISGGSTFAWEINDAAGVAGGPSGWDFLQIAQQLMLEATPANPLTIQVLGLNALNQPGTIANFDPTKSQEWKIAAADDIVGFDPNAVKFSFAGSSVPPWAFRSENFSLRADGDGLFIDYQLVVPEPNGMALAIGALTFWGVASGRCRFAAPSLRSRKLG
ncbi:MAG: hypothetical protein JNL18_23670 [Planctomycetaceae bacterium]|nr:hypothetical protein [Planctomycetaceae bacterium]